MKFAYADPPYLGRGRYYKAYHPEVMTWNHPATHRALVERLQDEFPDGWAMSLAEDSLRTILPMCPRTARVGCWLTVTPRYAPNIPVKRYFEPVIWVGGRSWAETGARASDYIICSAQGLPEGESYGGNRRGAYRRRNRVE
jgi:hypothetical protein